VGNISRLICDGTGVIAAIPGGTPLDAETVRREGADETWAQWVSGAIVAHASIWYRSTPSLDGHRTGIIGHFAAAPGADAGPLLDHLCARLAAQDCAVSVGPMNGNTWRTYRFIVDRGEEPPFFLELDHPPGWPELFRRAGFAPIAEYESTLVADLRSEDVRVARAAERLGRAGVRIRPIDPARAEEELRAIHRLSLAAFARAFLYTPIDEEEFLGAYRPLLPRVDPRLVLVAERAGHLAGYVFALPDLLERARGVPLRTVIVKTLAIRPDRVYAGLGAWLLADVHTAATARGFTRAIHALMHISNTSRALSGHWQSRRIRRYELFARLLA
jgi:L-amino acid N-acyltransferase YncA